MNNTQKNIMTDIILNFEGLQDCLETLLKEEEKRARELYASRGPRSEYVHTVRSCRSLRKSIRLLDEVVYHAGDAIGEPRAEAS